MKQIFFILAGWCCLLLAHGSFAQNNIVAAEYFIDTDPGFGNATPIVISTPAVSVDSFSFNAAISTLGNGIHQISVRTKDAGGKWSMTANRIFAKVQPLSLNPNTSGNITNAEYFFDNDPGAGQGTPISLGTPSPNLSSLTFNVNISTIPDGIHTLFVRTKDLNGWSITGHQIFAKVKPLLTNPNTSGNITNAEYFFDNDPGEGQGTPISVGTPSPNPSLTFNANTTTLPNGIHTLFVRTKDLNGWSITGHHVFAQVKSVSGIPHLSSKISYAEYFLDNDPGAGSGISIPLTPGYDINGLNFNVSLTGVASGLHQLYVRTRDSIGSWSITALQQFSSIQGLSSNSHVASIINKAEYFFDSDPGHGNGTDIPIAAPALQVSSLTFNANLSSLNDGIHTLYVRTRDSLGQWSNTPHFSFAKVKPVASNPHSMSNIVKAEYFVDTDPGFGNGTDVPVTASTQISGFSFNVNLTSLADGIHTLYLRTKDSQGKWSLTPAMVFAKVKALSANNNNRSPIVTLEYFVDIDPGLGNGNYVTITPDTTLQNVAFNVDLTTLINGPHTLYVRSKDAQNKWSITYVHAFNGGTGVLSVKILDFKAKKTSMQNVLLEWLTDQEKNVAHYLLEKSSDASTWAYLGKILPDESRPPGRKNYQFTDESPGRGIIYYRLTEVDLNGSTTRAPIRFVHMGEEGTKTSQLYPNPNDGHQISVQSELFSKGRVQVSIVSSDGRIVWQQNMPLTQSSVLTISDLTLASGSYFMHLQSDDASENLPFVVTNKY